jgi:hypothetical protein
MSEAIPDLYDDHEIIYTKNPYIYKAEVEFMTCSISANFKSVFDAWCWLFGNIESIGKCEAWYIWEASK